MAIITTTALASTEAKIIHIDTDMDIRPIPDDDWAGDEYAEMIRVVIEKDEQTIQSMAVTAGLQQLNSLSGLYFQGAGPFTLTPPSGWSPFTLVRQNIDPIEIDGSQFMRKTVEYITRNTDAAGDKPDWTPFAWGNVS